MSEIHVKVFKPTHQLTEIQVLGPRAICSPLDLSTEFGDDVVNFVQDDMRIVFDGFMQNIRSSIKDQKEPVSFEAAGPREFIFYNPKDTKAAIVTCGGLCPGINNVIRGIVRNLHNLYGVKKVVGVQYGFEGLVPSYGHLLLPLSPEKVDRIHSLGGTILGSSRGPQDPSEMVDTLVREGINQLYCVGGDGTFRAAKKISEEINKRKKQICVVCVPKTIDNDISFVEKTFGYETSVEEAARVIKAAHVEASGARNGIGLVKLMGRHSGFIAANSVLASNEVDFVLIPEVPFVLEGKKGFLSQLEMCLMKQGHAVVVVAEGAGQELFKPEKKETDASGNVRLQDIGVCLKREIQTYFERKQTHNNLKYIDPSYIIRSTPCNAHDAIFCARLAQNAVHAAMAGKTNVVVGYWHNFFTHIPVDLAVAARKQVHPESKFWMDVLAETRQPVLMVNEGAEAKTLRKIKKAG